MLSAHGRVDEAGAVSPGSGGGTVEGIPQVKSRSRETLKLVAKENILFGLVCEDQPHFSLIERVLLNCADYLKHRSDASS